MATEKKIKPNECLVCRSKFSYMRIHSKKVNAKFEHEFDEVACRMHFGELVLKADQYSGEKIQIQSSNAPVKRFKA